MEKALKERGRKRVYCLMVSKADLTDGRMRRQLEKALGKLDAKIRGRAKFLVFGIREMGQIGYRLHKLYCQGCTDVRPLTGKDLALILDRLHAQTMAMFAKSKPFTKGWVRLKFAKLLEDHATGKEIDDMLENKPEDRQAASR